MSPRAARVDVVGPRPFPQTAYVPRRDRQPNPSEQTFECRHFGVCGGCSLRRGQLGHRCPVCSIEAHDGRGGTAQHELLLSIVIQVDGEGKADLIWHIGYSHRCLPAKVLSDRFPAQYADLSVFTVADQSGEERGSANVL